MKKDKNNKNKKSNKERFESEVIMKRKTQITLCIVLLIIGVLILNLQVFVFETPDGILGFILFLFSVYLIIGSIIKLCKLSKRFKDTLITSLDLLFFIR